MQARLQAPLDFDSEENEKLKQIEEQHQLVSDRLQNQKLILVNRTQIVIRLNFNIDYSKQPYKFTVKLKLSLNRINSENENLNKTKRIVFLDFLLLNND